MEAFADDILYAVKDAVATITLCRESKRNALARRHFARLADVLRHAGSDEAVRVIVLTGEGDKAFCAGADLSPDQNFIHSLGDEATTGLGNYLRLAATVRKPIVGRINGHCYAGGVGLLAACDFAIGCDDIRIAVPEVKLGIFPFIVMAALEAKISRHHAMQLSLRGEPVSAARALEIGLLSGVVGRADLDEAVNQLASTLAGYASSAVEAGLMHCRYRDVQAYGEAIAEAEARGFEVARLKRVG